MKILSLIGYRGVGKSAVSGCLAARLGWKAIDADQEIERIAGMSIYEIFSNEGEASFRDRESSVIADLCGRDKIVLATGGGAILREENRHELVQAGPVVWLQAPLEVILERLALDPTTGARRPGLTSLPPADEVRHLLAVREPIYRTTAGHIVSTEGKTPDDIAAEILSVVHGSSEYTDGRTV